MPLLFKGKLELVTFGALRMHVSEGAGWVGKKTKQKLVMSCTQTTPNSYTVYKITGKAMIP